ncbi:1,4-alpha-glucan branching protein GlgB [Clostridium sp. SYSU_GA19001]|uniref:1,4-alpha-glucan branching protein GlgB n=1 Tax=Clostridium caldaquaticum TaxID=2940653 RepID=UPI002077379F|nr:1,4-alpha-glucan branching protein GlgB [Clostridium caldaquaticum]MCM8710196.1 1,4-alpha-glucan branching protein GlgB [Clostridium caldaquaticum]
MNSYKIKRRIKVNFKKAPQLKTYHIFGSHLTSVKGVSGVRFTLWAPEAKEVKVVGDFNNWIGTKHIMKNNKKLGIWTLFIEGLKCGDIYKYEITTSDGRKFLKADPYGFYSELRPNTASKIVNLNGYKWKDKHWLEQRASSPPYNKPMNIYEVHLASWKMKNGEFMNYKEIAQELLEYVKYMGYTHIELLPLTEHPLDASWGYQSTGYFSLTSRYGTLEDFMYFVDKFHENGIGVILDWVPGHFCKDAHGLYNFDGTRLYEYENPDLGENYDWGTSNFDLGKKEVRHFLINSALFWFDVYHIDGLRVDAVAHMLYLNYGKRENISLRNKFGGIENLEAIDFLKKLNNTVYKYFPNVLMIAEDSSSFPLITHPPYLGGVGFNYKWNMGWMNDMLRYMEMDPIYRKYHHNLITFSLMYAFSENFILPLSHDEVVHGKKSLLDKMPGDYWKKFASLRLFYGYMMAHPGKKLLFMGGEFGQFIEWNYSQSLDWLLLDYPMHKSLQNYVRELNLFYQKESSLWEVDHSYEGFQWIDHQNYEQSIISFMRLSKKKDDFIIIICNFTPVVYHNYKIGVPKFIHYKEVLNSDSELFGGSNVLNEGTINPEIENWHNQPFHIKIKIPPLSTIFIKPDYNYKMKNILEGGYNDAEKRNDSNDTSRWTRQQIRDTNKRNS